MRIFVVVSNSRMRGLGYHYAQAFTELGHDVLFHGLEDVAWMTIPGKIASRVRGMKPLQGTVRGKQHEQLVAAAAGFKPDIAIFMGSWAWDITSILFLKNVCRGKVAVMISDAPQVLPGFKSLEWLEALAEFDVVFVPAAPLIPVFYQLGAKQVETYTFSYAPEFHFPRNVPEVKTPVSYLGCWGPLQEKWLDRIASEFQLRIYGWGWHHASKSGKSRACWAKGEGIESEMGRAISSSKIIFNMVRAEHGCLTSTKTFEILACGGFMLTNRTEDHQALFEDDKECVFYNTMDDMMDKIRYYLEHDDEREKIRRAGMAAVAQYTYKNSAIALLNRMN